MTEITIDEIIKSSYKEAHEMGYSMDEDNKIIYIDRSSVSRGWYHQLCGISARIDRDIQTYFRGWKVIWE